MTTPDLTAGRAQLLQEMDETDALLGELMVKVARKQNEALLANDFTSMQTLSDRLITLNLQRAELARKQLKEIDDSETMQRALGAFAALKKGIEGTIKEIEEITEFLKAVAAAIGVLQKLISLVVL